MKKRAYNFSPGPSMLPTEVLEQAQSELLNWKDTGMSVMELSHRSPEFINLAEEIEQDFRELLSIPKHYKVLFLSGGAQVQFAMIPMNLLGKKRTMNYLCTGHWSALAINEAKIYGEVLVSANSEKNAYRVIPPVEEWKIDPEAAYLHYVDNETIHGAEFPYVPDIKDDLPIISDMSSNILTRPIDVSKFGLIYACAQKNLGPSGISIVIVREDLLGFAHPLTPTVFNYQVQAKMGSMRNTPPTFPWYMIGLNLKWVKKEGGLLEMQKRAERKSKKLYEFIDQSELYQNFVDPSCRSRINVTFHLNDTHLDALFLEKAKKAGLTSLKGHKVLGGMRASLYNAMPEEGVDALLAFMKYFEKEVA
jgi:phosphoserine aminotransferase